MKKIKVLCVDDSLVFRSFLSHALKESEHIEIAGTAMNGKVALQLLSTLNPDVITLDVNMPEMDGISTLKKIKEIRPETHVIMVSSLTSEGADTTLKAMELGASDFILKPVNESKDLINAFKLMLQKKIQRFGLESSFLPFNLNKNPGTEIENSTLAKAKSLIIPGKKPVCIICACEENQLGHLLLAVRALNPSECPVPVIFKIMVPDLFLESLINSFKRNNAQFTPVIETGQIELTQGTIYLLGEHHNLDLLLMSNKLRGIIHHQTNISSINDLFRNFKEAKLPNTPVCLMAHDSNSDGILALKEMTEKGLPTAFLTKNKYLISKKEWPFCNQVIDLNYTKSFFKGLF